MSDKDKKTKVKSSKDFISEAAENIESGVRIISKKASKLASNISDATTGIKDRLKEEVKEPGNEAISTARKAIEEISDTAQDYLDKFKNRSEMKKLSKEREEKINLLGRLVYLKLKSGRSLKNKIEDNEKLKQLISDIRKTDREIIKLGENQDK